MFRQSNTPRSLRRCRPLGAGVLGLALIAIALPASAQTQVPASPPAAATANPPPAAAPVPDASRPPAPDSVQPPQVQPASDLSSLLPRDLSPWGMFMNADK